MLCDVIHDAEAPIVFTGAIRPASAPGADGPANFVDAVSVAASEAAAGMGVLVVLRRRDPPRALRAQDRHDLAGRVLVAADRAARPGDRGPPDDLVAGAAQPAARPAAPRPRAWSSCPPSPATTAPWPAPRSPPTRTGVVIGTLGAGHLAPPLLEVWAEAAERIPVVAYCRPERGVILNATYGYRGSERDLRETRDHPGRLPLAAGRADEAAGLPGLRARDRRDPLGVSPGRRLAQPRGTPTRSAGRYRAGRERRSARRYRRAACPLPRWPPPARARRAHPPPRPQRSRSPRRIDRVRAP